MIKCLGAALTALLLLAACSANGSSRPGLLPEVDSAATPPIEKYIKHVVIIVQENRSMDNFFSGYPNADTATSGTMSTGKVVKLQQIEFIPKDILHRWIYGVQDWDNGKMDKFDLNLLQSGKPAGTYPYSFVDRKAVAPYWTMAQQYVLGDHMFATMFGGSFTAHLDLVAGTTNVSATRAVVDEPDEEPWGCDAPAGTIVGLLTPKRVIIPDGLFPCFTQFRTMKDVMDAAKISWKYYQPPAAMVWSAFDAIKNVRETPEWNTNVISPQTAVLTDAAAGKLADISWVIPDFQDSDHAGSGSDTGPSWVAAVVNAIGKSPDWNSTAIFVVWDDWGGWYDSMPPPQKDFVGLGLRVPVLVISPYAKKNYVAHTQYEFASILRFTEEAFGLPRIGPPSLGYTDTRASDMSDGFDFTQAPRAFKKIPAKYPPSHFLGERPSDRPPDND